MARTVIKSYFGTSKMAAGHIQPFSHIKPLNHIKQHNHIKPHNTSFNHIKPLVTTCSHLCPLVQSCNVTKLLWKGLYDMHAMF